LLSFWLQEEFLDVWNISEKKNGDVKLLHLTNNGLERYNKHFNSICPTSHPNLVSFVHALKKESERVEQRLDDVAKGREVPPVYDEPIFPDIPDDFYLSEPDEKPKAKKRGKGKKRG
jgi:hypothetical protein